MDIIKKELYEVFADSLEKSRTKEGGLLFDKLFEDMWKHIEPKLGQKKYVEPCFEFSGKAIKYNQGVAVSTDGLALSNDILPLKAYTLKEGDEYIIKINKI